MPVDERVPALAWRHYIVITTLVGCSGNHCCKSVSEALLTCCIARLLTEIENDETTKRPGVDFI